MVGEGQPPGALEGLSEVQRAWLASMGFTGAARKQVAIPGLEGDLAGVVLGVGDGSRGDPCGPSELLLGQLAASLPPGRYQLAAPVDAPETAAVAWGLGAYRFRRYKSNGGEAPPGLVLPAGADRSAVERIVEAVWLGRDLINTPASDLGPAELEAAVRRLAERHDASVSVTAGDELAAGFPLINAVGRASARAPRLIDLVWGAPGAPKITLVGKGICFDTGGLDVKPAAGMLIMKKDMGGAAAALALAHMIMGLSLPVRLRVLIPAAENSISGDAFRPGDVLRSRSGRTVEIGNTDAEGRLVLADALTLADEERPDRLISFATLTGAARVALGPDVPPLYTDDDALAAELAAAGLAVGDPLWRMPFWEGYERLLDSEVADMNNVPDAPFAGSVTAALFLRRFVRNAGSFAHLDIYGWRPAARPLGPKGGEPQAARAVFEVLRDAYGSGKGRQA
ncbi:MAG: leucyl aminopeptidase family protein [Hyphomicrobiaceae bacterium]|nr:leucyl aminopeptidase family protein [Hyphomicrobiaceae bacterium]